MSSRTSPRANPSDFPGAAAPGLFRGLRAALLGWFRPTAPAGPAAVDERGLSVSPDPDLHYLRRIAGSAGRWKRQLAEAKAVWPRASMADLVATDGHVPRLACLLQERYQISHAEAEAEVLSFFAARSP